VPPAAGLFAGVWAGCVHCRRLAHGWAQPAGQAIGHGAEVVLGQRALTQRPQLWQVVPQFFRHLLGTPDRHLQQSRRLGQTQRIGLHKGRFMDGRHKPLLVIHQDDLGFKGIKQHGHRSVISFNQRPRQKTGSGKTKGLRPSSL